MRLVIVPGHGVAKFWKQDLFSDDAWLGPPRGEARQLIEHIEAGVKLVARDPDATLVFSGGQTKRRAGPVSEGSSYWFAASRLDWFGRPDVRERAFAETYARDSFENLLFSVLHFFRQRGSLPDKIVFCGWAFKKKRVRYHASTLCLESIFSYNPVNDPPEALDLARISEGEADTLREFKAVPFGDAGELLQKRARRDPLHQGGLENYGREIGGLERRGLVDVASRNPLRVVFRPHRRADRRR